MTLPPRETRRKGGIPGSGPKRVFDRATRDTGLGMTLLSPTIKSSASCNMRSLSAMAGFPGSFIPKCLCDATTAVNAPSEKINRMVEFLSMASPENLAEKPTRIVRDLIRDLRLCIDAGNLRIRLIGIHRHQPINDRLQLNGLPGGVDVR